MLSTKSYRRILSRCTLLLLALAFIAAAEPPQTPPVYAEKLEEGQELLGREQYNEAVKAFKEADRLAGGACVECRIGLARSFNKLGAYKEALKNVDLILKATTKPDDLVAAYNERGVASVALAGQDPAQLEQAVQAFRKVLELSGGKINAARFNLGFTLLRLSRDEEGITILKEYLEKDPNAGNAEMAKGLIANPVRARKRLVPDFEVVTLGGDYLTTADVQGKVLLLDFWGTWCAPCVAAVPSLRSLARRMEKDPFVLLSVSTDTDEATLREFVAKHEMSWPQVWDKQHQFARKCQVEGYPTYMLVSHEGEILYLVRGWSEGIERDLNLKVASAIRAAKKGAKAGG